MKISIKRYISSSSQIKSSWWNNSSTRTRLYNIGGNIGGTVVSDVAFTGSLYNIGGIAVSDISFTGSDF